MKTKLLVSVTALCSLSIAGMAVGADSTISGQLGLTARTVNEDKSAKFMEYRDFSKNLYGDIGFGLDKGPYHFEVTGTDMGLDSQRYLIEGGRYGSFKYSLFYDELIHNISFDARTPYSGVNGNQLTYSGAFKTNPDTWNVFDYSIHRKSYGANFEASLNTPFYLAAGFKQTEVDGVKPYGIPIQNTVDSSGGASAAEVAAPTEHLMRTVNMATGYRSKRLILTLDGSLSKFYNDYSYLAVMDPRLGGALRYQTLEPDNDSWKIGSQAVIRLPLDSALALRGSYSRTTNSVNVLPSAADPTLEFDGDIRYTTASVAYTISPIKPIDVKLFYNYLNKSNQSNTFTYQQAGVNEFPHTRVFDYQKQNAGIDTAYKLPFQTKLDVGYEYLKVKRSRYDAEQTKDHIIYTQLKNSYFDILSAKVRYQHLDRSADFDSHNLSTNPAQAAYILNFQRRFDVTDKNQDAVKVGIDLEPLEHLEMGIEYAFKVNDYDKAEIGRTKDRRHEVTVDASYLFPRDIKLSGYATFERVEMNSKHRTMGAPIQADPNGASGAANYNWKARERDYNQAYGVALDVPIVKDKLDFLVSWDYEDADGKAEFSVQNNLASPSDIGNYDDYTRKSLNARATYHATKNIQITAGYLHENFTFDDAQLDNYRYVTGTNYLSGAYKDHDYEAHVGYLTAAYKF